MSSTAEIDERIAEMQEASEALRIDIRQANEAIAKLRNVKREIKELLDKEVPTIVAEAVAQYIPRSNLGETKRARK